MLLYLLEFFIFSFAGWIIDSLYTSIGKKRWVSSGYFKGVPLCPVYGFGGILLLSIFTTLSDLPSYLVVLITTIVVVLFELIMGELAEKLLDERLWDYRTEKFNLYGYISLWHSFCWLILIAILYTTVGRRLVGIVSDWELRLALPRNVDIMLFFVVAWIAIWLTARNKRLRLAKLLEKELSETKDLETMFDLEKWAAASRQRRDQLLNNWHVKILLNKLEELRKLRLPLEQNQEETREKSQKSASKR